MSTTAAQKLQQMHEAEQADLAQLTAGQRTDYHVARRTMTHPEALLAAGGASAIESSERFENSTDGRTCGLRYENAEVLPLHRFDLPGAPVSAYRARGFIYSASLEHRTEWHGPRRETVAEAAADADAFAA